jgi:hypothetical protein
MTTQSYAKVMIEALPDGGYVINTPVCAVNWRQAIACGSEEEVCWWLLHYLTGKDYTGTVATLGDAE